MAFGSVLPAQSPVRKTSALSLFGQLILSRFCRRKPLLVVYGMESEEMRTAHTLVPTMKTVRVKPKYPFGSHHS